MGIISVVCPNCRSRLSIQDTSGIQDKILACPVCQYKAKVSVYQIGQVGKGGLGSSDSDTVLSGGPVGKNVDIGQMRVIQTGQICDLRKGSQILGRLAESKKADLQIGSINYSDPYMSRLSVKIDIIETSRGIEHHLVDVGSTNPIKVNGKKINPGDVVVLNFGDKLTLGRTDLILEETNEESTKII